MLSRNKHEKIYSKRRRHRDFFFGYPAYKRWIRRLEQINKFLWTNALGKLLGIRNVKAPLDPKTVRSILFIRNDAIGDMILTTPLWHAIRTQFPYIRIGVAASFRNRAILDHDPNVDRIFDATDGELYAMFRARKEIRKEPWDVVMPMLYYRKTRMAIITWLLSPGSISSMLVKPGENLEKRKKLFSIIVPSPYRTGEIEMIEQMRIHLTGTLDMQIPDNEWKPYLYPDRNAVESVNNRIAGILNEDGSTRYIHINLEAKTEYKEYGVKASFELSQKLVEVFPATSVLWTTSPQAALEVESFLAGREHSHIHYFTTASIHELIGVVKTASLVVTPDTSVVHIASAYQRPVVALYPIYHEWPPYKSPHRLLLSERKQPVSSIPVSEVLAACRTLLLATESLETP